MSDPTPKPFVFDYTKYQTPGITPQILDNLAASVFNPDGTTGIPAMVYSALKLVIALAYIWARDKLVSQQQQIEMQQYQVSETNNNQNEVNQ